MAVPLAFPMVSTRLNDGKCGKEVKFETVVVGTVVQSNGGGSLPGVRITGTQWVNEALGFDVHAQIQADPKAVFRRLRGIALYGKFEVLGENLRLGFSPKT